jgi:hypothetical protein
LVSTASGLELKRLHATVDLEDGNSSLLLVTLFPPAEKRRMVQTECEILDLTFPISVQTMTV